jgi:hypothetical protein
MPASQRSAFHGIPWIDLGVLCVLIVIDFDSERCLLSTWGTQLYFGGGTDSPYRRGFKPDAVAPIRSISFRMPFTVSHAAAVLPFRKLNLVWSAFIIGSMAPDFPYIVGNTDYRAIGHHFPGILEFTFPAAFLALWMFHNVIKGPIVGLLPPGMQARLRDQLEPFPFGGLRRFLAIFASISLGIATHIVWDAFTHSYTWPYYHIRVLRGSVYVPFIGRMPIHSASQYASSIIGLAALAAWVLLWYRKTPAVETGRMRRPRSRFVLAVVIFLVAALAGLIRALLVVGMPATRSNADVFLLVFCVTTLALAFWQLLLYCVLVSSHQMWIIN